MQCRQRRLGIEVDGQYAVSGQRQILGEVGSRRRLAGSALEIDDSDYLQLVAWLAVRNIFLHFGPAIAVEIMPQFQHLLGSVGAAPGSRLGGHGAFALEVQPLEVVLCHAQIMGHFCHRKLPQCLPGIRRKLFHPKLIQPARNLCTLIENLVIKLELWQRHCDVHRNRNL